MDDRNPVVELALRRGFVMPSSEIYGGLAGFYDYGPVGTLMKNKLISLWRHHCIRKEGYVEIDGANILREEVLKASGHVKSFTDPLTRCSKCKNSFRADHLVEEATGQRVEGLDANQLTKKLEKVKCPNCGGKLSKVELFHTMFDVRAGTSEGTRAYLRPETAQSIFINFPRLFSVTREKLPLGVGQVGRAFRNEISPRNFLIRMREFTQMEIEIFLSPDQLDSHPNWNEIKDVKLRLVKQDGKEVETTPEEMVRQKIAPNQYLAYWVGKAWLFYSALGIPRKNMRMKHLPKDETPFYSKSNFDLEVKTSFGWKEALGTAYRTDHDLSEHAKLSGKKMEAMFENGKIIPHVIEPSWGVDRPFYMILEAAYRPKTKEKDWEWLQLPPVIAPYISAVFPLMRKDGQPEKALEVTKNLLEKGFDVFYDKTGSIGKRYARADEIGTPFCITIDYDTAKDNTVTLRHRDTGKQDRVKIEELPKLLGEALNFELNA